MQMSRFPDGEANFLSLWQLGSTGSQICHLNLFSNETLVNKGNSFNLCKVSAKRRRSKAEILEAKAQEEAKKAEVEQKLQRL